MYFNKLLVKNFGKFNNREIELKKGLISFTERMSQARPQSRNL